MSNSSTQSTEAKKINDLEDKVAKLEQVLNTLKLRVEMLLTNHPDVKRSVNEFELERLNMDMQYRLKSMLYESNPELLFKEVNQQLEDMKDEQKPFISREEGAKLRNSS